MRKAINLILPAVVFVLLGCSVQSTQLNTVLDFFTKSNLDLSANAWNLQYENYQSKVYAISTSEGILFSNALGDELLFDGWTVRLLNIRGGREVNIIIEDSNENRVFKNNKFVIGTHVCDTWSRETGFNFERWVQRCEYTRNYENSILVDRDGNISIIRQVVDNRYSAITLTRKK